MKAARHLELASSGADSRFDADLMRRGLGPLHRSEVRTVQLNLGKRCNMACHHCHVDAGPKRTEVMSRAVAERSLDLADRSQAVDCVDLTGGAPELNPNFTWLVEQTRQRGWRVIDRCNLTVLLEPGHEDLPAWLANHEVHVVASLPCYLPGNVDAQRGKDAFSRSLEGLRRLNAAGYGQKGSGSRLDLVYNPLGPTLPPAQATLAAQYRLELGHQHGVTFDDLLTITNMPIERFAHQLEREGTYEDYLALLVAQFNLDTVPEVMCRSLVSVSWDGLVYDCDFNQMLAMGAGRQVRQVWDIDSFDELVGDRIATGVHCFGCTAGAGSSCSGALGAGA